MLVSLELGADFSRGSAYPAAQPLISTTHSYPSIRELTLGVTL